MRAIVQEPGVVGAHLLRHEQPDIATTTEQRIRSAPDKPGDWVLMACGYARNALLDFSRKFDADTHGGAFNIAREGEWQTFSLSYSAVPSDFA